jgi:pantoate--beta-alanine ligase
MAGKPSVQRSVSGLRKALGALRGRGAKVALVPTMGALHDGHLSLVRLAKKRAKRVVVSIFVNPAQFAPSEDFASYPRNFADDLAALAALKIDLVWAPTAEAMYPSDFATHIIPAGPANVGLEDAARPHFFPGVATVVGKLFLQVEPDFAVFGEKDYQQLKVVTRMAQDLDLALKVIGAPTVRERDGLAMSSRNAYLSAAERAIAPGLFRVLQESARKIKSGQLLADVMAVGRAKIEREGFRIDYFEARHAETLSPIASSKKEPMRLLVAAKLGNTRLIDNVAV